MSKLYFFYIHPVFLTFFCREKNKLVSKSNWMKVQHSESTLVVPYGNFCNNRKLRRTRTSYIWLLCLLFERVPSRFNSPKCGKLIRGKLITWFETPTPLLMVFYVNKLWREGWVWWVMRYSLVTKYRLGPTVP